MTTENRVPGRAVEFLRHASEAWESHLGQELGGKSAPAVLLLHLPAHTEPWPCGVADAAFVEAFGPWPKAFEGNSRVITGCRDSPEPFSHLITSLEAAVKSSRREPRPLRVVLSQLEGLQTRFSFRSVEQTFGARGKLASLLFGCCAICDVCHVRCVLPRGAARAVSEGVCERVCMCTRLCPYMGVQLAEGRACERGRP